jgi:hypothetical protein
MKRYDNAVTTCLYHTMRAVSRLQKITWSALAKMLLFYISITTKGCFYHKLKSALPFSEMKTAVSLI